MGPLHVVGNAKETHIHANIWGLGTLALAGLLVDFYPVWLKRPALSLSKRPFAYPKSITPIFWLITAGAFGLIFGPWLGNDALMTAGFLIYLAGTLWLLLNVVKPIWRERSVWNPGTIHLIAAYAWVLTPLFLVPLAVSGYEMPIHVAEANAPQGLVYGWMLQFGYAIIPYFFTRVFLPDEKAKLGGTWLSVTAVNLGLLFLWVSIFIQPAYSILYGIAYLLWTISILPIAAQLWSTTRRGMDRLEGQKEQRA